MNGFKTKKTIYEGTCRLTTAGWRLDSTKIAGVLIREAAKCINYASDLMYDWQAMHEALKEPGFKGGDFWFAFREQGVDGLQMIKVRTGDTAVYGDHPYFSVYRLWLAPGLQGDRDEMYVRFDEMDSPYIEARRDDCLVLIQRGDVFKQKSAVLLSCEDAAGETLRLFEETVGKLAESGRKFKSHYDGAKNVGTISFDSGEETVFRIARLL